MSGLFSAGSVADEIDDAGEREMTRRVWALIAHHFTTTVFAAISERSAWLSPQRARNRCTLARPAVPRAIM